MEADRMVSSPGARSGSAPAPGAATGRRHALGLLWRAVLVLAAAGAGLLALPTAITTVLPVAATAVVAERAARLRRRGPTDAALVGVGSTVVALALLGVVLNFLPWGITRSSWSVGAGVVGLVVLAACATRPGATSPVTALRLRPSWLTGAGVAGAVAVLAASVVISVVSYDSNQVVPLQLFAAGPVVDGRVTVVVDATEPAGPLALVQVTAAGTTVLDEDVRLAAGARLSRTVTIPSGFRVQIELRRAGQGAAVRTLIFDGGALLPAAGS